MRQPSTELMPNGEVPLVVLDHDYAINRDFDLITAAQAGDLNAIGDLYSIHGSAIKAKLMRLTEGDSFRSEDLTQDTFYKALSKIDQLTDKHKGAFPWLATIARNTFLDSIRYQQTRPIDYTDQPLPETEALSVPGVDDIVVDRMEIRRLLGITTQERSAAIIAIHRWGLNYVQAAQLLGVADGTVKSRVNRGRQAIIQAELSGESLVQNADGAGSDQGDDYQ